MKKHLLIVLLSLSFIGCGHLGFKTANSRSTKIAKASSTKPKARGTIAKVKPGKIKFKLSKEDSLFFELSGLETSKLNENQIYKKIVEKYRQNDLKAVIALTNLLMSKYPFSIYADNALYLSGNLAFVEKNYGKSLELYNRLLDNFPMSNKAVSALFAKGVLYKRMNLITQADRAFQQVAIKYPGSPEALRSEIERKLLK